MKDVSQFQAILSAICAFIGSIALLISFLICGHNVFRDLPFRVSATMSGFLGFWLFMFSPVSFVILFPDLFAPSPIEVMDAGTLVETIHGLLQEVLASFILSAVGVGIIIGALSEYKPRKTFLKFLNKKFGLQLRQYSYEFAWDGFLRGIKQLGRITLVLQDKEISGQLQNYSVTSEPKQLIMRRCRITTLDDGKIETVDNLLITELGEIKAIKAQQNAMKKHYHDLNHCSQAAYLIITSLGFAMLSISCELTIAFFRMHDLEYLVYLYGWACIIFSFLSAGSLISAVKALKHDFQTFTATAIFYPLLTFSFAVMVPVSYWFLLDSLGIVFGVEYLFMNLEVSTWPVILVSLLLIIYSFIKGNSIPSSLRKFVGDNYSDLRIIKEVIEQLYLLSDVNDFQGLRCIAIEDSVVENIAEWNKGIEIKTVKLRDVISKVRKAISELIECNPVLQHEEANIIMKWYQILKNNHFANRCGRRRLPSDSSY